MSRRTRRTFSPEFRSEPALLFIDQRYSIKDAVSAVGVADSTMRATHRTADQWQTLVNEQKVSGLSARKYCEQNNVAYASFSKWRKQLTKPTTASESPAFIELTTPTQTENVVLTVSHSQ